MKKVAYIASGKIGIHRFTYNELQLLSEKGIEFDLCLTQLNKGPWMPKNEWRCYTANKIKAIIQFINLIFSNKKTLDLFFEARKKKVLFYFFIALSLYKDIKKNNITSLHCQMGDDKLYIGYYLKKLMKLPLTVTVHAHELYQRKVYDENKNLRELYDACDKVITISDFNAKIIHEQFGVEIEKIKVMRLYPDIDKMNDEKQKAKILIVANWVKKKGYDTLLKALKDLDRRDYILWVVGGPVLSDDTINVIELVEKYRMQDKVEILGSQGSPIIDIIFQACDIFVLPSITDYYEDGNPSEREGIPVALMEAMALGKPVIATEHAGNSELVENILVEEKNERALSEAIKYLLDNPDEWRNLGEKNIKIINDKYSKSNIDILIKLFKSI